MRKLLDKIISLIRRLTETIFLSIAYFIGIGVTSIFAKILGKRFLKAGKGLSTWENVKPQIRFKKMY